MTLVSKVTGGTDRPFLYLPKQIRKILNLKKGDYVVMEVDQEGKQLIVRKLDLEA